MAQRNLAKTLLLGGAFSLVLSVSLAEAQRGGGRGGGGGGGARASAGGGGGGGARASGARSAPTSINGNRGGGNVNRGGGNVNRGGGNTVNNVNVNRNVAVAGGGGYGYNNGCCNGGYDNDGYHPVAAAMVVGATAAVVSNAIAPKPVVVAPY